MLKSFVGWCFAYKPAERLKCEEDEQVHLYHPTCISPYHLFISGVFIFFNQFLTFWSTSLCICLKDYLFLYACQLIFCNLYFYVSEKRQLFVKQLTLLAPSFFCIRIKFACPHVSNMYTDSL